MEVAVAKTNAVDIYYVSLSIDYAGKIVIHYGISNLLQCVGRMKCIAGIEEYDVFSLRHPPDPCS